MPAPSSLYTRAARPSRSRHLDSIWITDDVLEGAVANFNHGFHRPRRYGSSIPGPLESRRRLGKRQMTYSPVGMPLAPMNLWSILDSFGLRNTVEKWRWEPPSRQPDPTIASGPDFLDAMTKLLEAVDEPKPRFDDTNSIPTVQEYMSDFRTALLSAAAEDLPRLCKEFNQRFQQCLTLGLVSDKTLRHSLRSVPQILRRVASEQKTAEALHRAFVSATIRGVVESKVLSTKDFDVKTLNHILWAVINSFSGQASAKRASRILMTATPEQLREMKSPLLQLFNSWLDLWSPARSNTRQDRSSWLPEWSRVLGYAMGHLPPTYSCGNVRARLRRISHSLLPSNSDTSYRESLKHSWLLFSTGLRYADPSLLADIWNKVHHDVSPGQRRAARTHAEEISLCKFILDFYQHRIDSGSFAATRHNYIELVQKDKITSPVTLLLQALDDGQDTTLTQRIFALEFLHQTASSKGLSEATKRMISSATAENSRVTAPLLVTSIQQLSTTDPLAAVELLHITSRMKGYRAVLESRSARELLISIIDNDKFNATHFWRAIDTTARTANLKPERIDFFEQAATKFAQSRCHSPRSALRSVRRCILYLRAHRVPISGRLVRALLHAGVIRDLVQHKWVSSERIGWILGNIEVVEGVEIAEELAALVIEALRLLQRREVEARLRRSNPLRLCF